MEAGVFQKFFSALPEPTVLLSFSGEILACNRAVDHLLGEVCARHVNVSTLHDIVSDPPDKVDRFLRLCRRSRDLLPGALTCKTTLGAEVPCRVEGALLTVSSDTSPGTLLVRVFPKRSSHSQFLVLNERVEALHREILERQRTQAKLHDEREWLRTTLASIGDAVIATDYEGTVSFMNAVAESLTGWSQEDAVGQPLDNIFQIINEDSRSPVESPVAQVLRQGGIVGLANHTLLISRDGTERPISDSGAPIRDVAGKIIGVVLVFRDATEAQRTQDLIAQSEKRFRRIFDNAHVSIWEQDLSEVKQELAALQKQGVTDFQTYFSEHPEFLQRTIQLVRTVDVNPAAVELSDAKDKSELLASLPRLFASETFGVFAQELLAIVEGRNTFQSEAPMVTLQGKPLDVLFTMSCPPDDPTLSRVLISLMDITDRKRSEEALRRANQALQRANSDLEHFAYAAAHDLQEPLRNVVLYTQVLNRNYGHAFDEKGREASQITIEGGRRMQSLVQGLLEYTRVVSETNVEHDTQAQSVVDCATLLASVRENLRSSIEEAHAKIICEELPSVNARDTHLLQLFQNLVSNAIKYRKPGEDPIIRIQARQKDSKWMFLVEDNGVGIRPEYHRKIFEAFKRLHSREIPGVGMGLTICSRIVAHYGGEIWVESQVGRGSTFVFTLPRHPSKPSQHNVN